MENPFGWGGPVAGAWQNRAMDTDAKALGELIAGASSVLLVTGAGVSTESGIPDYRGPHGVWNTQRPVEFGDFLRSPERRVEYWEQKLAGAPQLEAATPGGVHRAAVLLEQAGRLEAVVTQNIDGLHSMAGTSPDRLVEVHGTGRMAGCLSCGIRTPIEPHLEAFERTRRPPTCGECGGLLKPATISFGQQLDPLTIQRAIDAAEACDCVIALGTTLSVYPAADIPVHAARRGVPYAIVNRGRTEHDALPWLTLRIDADVGTVFPDAVDIALGT